MPSGGARAGAGRKAMDPEQKKVRLLVWLKPETAKKLEEMRQEGEKIGAVIERLVKP